jgi:hypothetical protein
MRHDCRSQVVTRSPAIVAGFTQAQRQAQACEFSFINQ